MIPPFHTFTFEAMQSVLLILAVAAKQRVFVRRLPSERL